MALLKLKQFRSNLSYNTGTNVLTVSGSLVSIQSNPNFQIGWIPEVME
jgi:hypothetical protein